MTKTLSAYSILIDLPARIARGERISLEEAEDQLFRRLKLANGTYKTTERGRLEEVDAAFVSVLAACASRPGEFLDVAASSGVTTLDWLGSLRAAGLSPRMTISDLNVSALFVTPFPWLRVLVDGQNVPLEFEVFGRTLRARVKKIDLFTGNFLPILAARAFYRLVRAAQRRRFQVDTDAEETVRPLPLLAHAVRACPDITCIEDDITVPNTPVLHSRFDVIRAANILHRRYFDERTIRRALQTLKERLKGDGAWLIVCRTDEDRTNHGSIFRIEHDQFVEKASVGNGSDISDLITTVAT